MPVALNRVKIVDQVAPEPPPIWMHLVIIAAAGLCVSLLVMTYGIDLSPGLF